MTISALSIKYGSNEFGYVFPPVLIIAIGIDDNMGARSKGGIESRHKGMGESFSVDMLYNMIHARFLGCFKGIVRASVIYNQDFYTINARDLSGDLLNR